MFFFFAPCEKVWDRFQSRFPRQYRTDHTDPNRTNPFARNPIASEEGGRFHRSVNYSLHLNGKTERGDAATRIPPHPSSVPTDEAIARKACHFSLP